MSENQEILKTVAPLAGVAGVLMLLWTVTLYGVGSEIHWPDIDPRPSLSATVTPQLLDAEIFPPLTKYANVWLEPIFNAGRVPDKSNAKSESVKPVPPLTGYMLTGVIVTQQIKVALLKLSAGEVVSAREGQMLPNGWRVDQINERHVTLIYEQNRRILEILTPKLPMKFP
jgi:hypothetical protein